MPTSFNSVSSCPYCSKSTGNSHKENLSGEGGIAPKMAIREYVEKCVEFWTMKSKYVDLPLFAKFMNNTKLNRRGQCVYVITPKWTMVKAVLSRQLNTNDQELEVFVPRSCVDESPKTFIAVNDINQYYPVMPLYMGPYSDFVTTKIKREWLIGVLNETLSGQDIAYIQSSQYQGQTFANRFEAKGAIERMLKILQSKFSRTTQNSMNRVDELLEELTSFEVLACPNFWEHFHLDQCMFAIEKKIKFLEDTTSDENHYCRQEYIRRVKLLQHLHYITRNGTLTKKGIATSQIAESELLLMELTMDGFFDDYSNAIIAGVVSALAVGRSNAPKRENTKLNWENQEMVTEAEKLMYSAKEHLLKVSHRLDELIEMYEIENEDKGMYNWDYMVPTYLWAKKMNFKLISNLTYLQEGLLVRCILRVSEILRSVQLATTHMGFDEVAQKIGVIITSLRRDIAFIPSLYTQ
ncbi:hypothetical protein ACOME3_009911 [Neoechinorhynchus agilis]